MASAAIISGEESKNAGIYDIKCLDNKLKSGGCTPSANANALAGTPKANSRNSTDNSITENAEKSNP